MKDIKDYLPYYLRQSCTVIRNDEKTIEDSICFGLLQEIWIPVTTQLPPDGEVVEGKFKQLYFTYDVYYKDGKWYYQDSQLIIFTPTHWRKKQ